MRWWGRASKQRQRATIPPLVAVRSLTTILLDAEAALAAGDWAEAARQFRAAADRNGDDPEIWLRLAAAEEELGRAVEAEASVRRALALDDANPLSHRALAHVLDLLGHSDQANAARAAAMLLDVDRSSGRESTGSVLKGADRWRLLSEVAAGIAQGERSKVAALHRTGYPPGAWDSFRRDIPIAPPPSSPGLPRNDEITVLVDATHAAPFLLRETLRSLQDQTLVDWRARVVAPAALSDHPVAGFADGDPRIVFGDGVDALAATGRVLALDAGTALDRTALAWLSHALDRTAARAAFADHDHGIFEPSLGIVRDAPVLYGAFDRWMLAESAPPALVMAERSMMAAIAAREIGGARLRRALLLAADAAGSIAHVPRALATRLALPLVAHGGRPSPGDDEAGRLGPPPPALPSRAVPAQDDARIAVVIPTRDAPDMLARAIESLRTTARNPARLDIVILDNRSTEEATQRLFAQLESEGIARRLPYDAAFNYSLMCNVGAAASDAPVLLFANNDIEMLTDGWDDALLAALADRTVGAVGARLLYPNGTVQHAGIAFGFGYGGVEHEGRDVPAGDTGPAQRYVTTHAAAAVTGAFLAIRRDDFEAVSGFDAARLTIAYSDIDLCLKLRERGLVILYCPAIEAVHHESVTRGRNETRQAVAWDESERADFVARWGGELQEDPGVSPYWVRGGLVFEGVTEPPTSTILAHIDRSARGEPWRPTRRDASVAERWSRPIA